MSLKVANLSKTYKRPFSRTPPLQAVRNVDFEIGTGEIYALLGPNGAGKSTTIKMIAGLIIPTDGIIEINGLNMVGRDARTYKELSAILEGIRNVYWRLTPLENLHYFANLRGVPSSVVEGRAEELLTMLEIDGKKRNQSQHLSRGMLQKLALAAALITNPSVLLLDEPTLGLDVASGRKIKDVILELARKEGKTILLTTHQMDLVEELADRVGIIRNGSLIREGSLADLKAIFKSYIYRFKVRGRYRPRKEWKNKGGAKVLGDRPDVTEFEMDCGSSAGVYRVLSALKADKKELISMGRVVEDLEEVLLMVLSEEDGQPAAVQS